MTKDTIIPVGVRAAHAVARFTVAAAAIALTAWSAVIVKEASVRTPLAQTAYPAGPVASGMPASASGFAAKPAPGEASPEAAAPAPIVIRETEPVIDAGTVRWFDGRPVRPARTIWMRVTAYSPDARSCGKWADGQTATLHSVWTNGMRLVAADTRVLPYGSIITVPGYADDEIVPVLDCGGAIKGNRLDVLYPTHEIARAWGVRDVAVTVWEYADE